MEATTFLEGEAGLKYEVIKTQLQLYHKVYIWETRRYYRSTEVTKDLPVPQRRQIIRSLLRVKCHI